MFSILRPNLRLTLAAAVLTAGALAAGGAVSASADNLGAFTCTDKSGGVAGARGTVTAIRFAHHDGYDRLVIGFATSNSMPEYRLTQQSSATFTQDASGRPVALDGSAGSGRCSATVTSPTACRATRRRDCRSFVKSRMLATSSES